MFSRIKAAALSALFALGGFSAMPATAQADGFYFGVGPHGGVYGGVHSTSSRHYRPPHVHSGPACSPRHAVNKASRMGVRHARVRSVNHRVIRVGGRDRHGPVTVRFARAPGCPLLR